MAENSGTVAILVALIGAAGLLGAKYLDLIGKPAVVAPVQGTGGTATGGTATGGGTTPVAPPPDVVVTTPPEVPVRTVATPPARAERSPDSDETPVDPRKAVAPSTTVAEVGGAWHDQLHQAYQFVQTGGMVRMTGPLFPMGMMATVGNLGVQWSFTEANGNMGTCSGPLMGEQLQIMCVSGRGNVPFPLHRPSS